MISYRQSLKKIGITETEPVSYKAFSSRPVSLLQAIRSMDAPKTGDWKQVMDIPLKTTDWTEKCNGVAYDGQHWIFSSNESKSIYLFKAGTSLTDKQIDSTFTFNKSHLPPNSGDISHIGQLTYFNGLLYVAHFNENAHVFVLKIVNGKPEFVECISLEKVEGRLVEFQAINPWNKMIYTSFGGGEINRLFMHHLEGPDKGKKTGGFVKLTPPIPREIKLFKVETPFGKIDKTYYPIQGACFSPNGHLYISSNIWFNGNGKYQTIYCYAALNGHLFGKIPVLAEGIFQELEGITYAGGRIYAVLLDSLSPTDDIFFKAFAANDPAIV